jgi:hypothetical protein
MPTKLRFGLPKGKLRDSYVERVLAFPLASIKSEEHLNEAQKVMDRLLAGEPKGDAVPGPSVLPTVRIVANLWSRPNPVSVCLRRM